MRSAIEGNYLKIDFRQDYIAIILVVIAKHAQSTRTSDFLLGYIIILYGAMFDFADMTANRIVCRNIEFTSCVFCPLAIVMPEIHRQDCFNKRNQEARME